MSVDDANRELRDRFEELKEEELEKEKRMYAKLLAERLMYPFYKWEAEKHGFTDVKEYLEWRVEEDWKRNQFHGVYVSEGDQHYIQQVMQGYTPKSYRGLDSINAVLLEYGYGFAEYQPNPKFKWNPEIGWYVNPSPKRRSKETVLNLPASRNMFPVGNYSYDRETVKAVLLRHGWTFGVEGWEKP